MMYRTHLDISRSIREMGIHRSIPGSMEKDNTRSVPGMAKANRVNKTKGDVKNERKNM